jgi:hypothetical protein
MAKAAKTKSKTIDKLIVTNVDALKEKYGDNGCKQVLSAVHALIAADLKRGIHSVLVDLSNAATMKSYGVNKPVAGQDADDEKKNKAAIDAIFKSLDPEPQYLLLLGSIDVIPHIRLDNPMEGDGDADVPSDLPYASAAKFSRHIGDFLRPTRVVGRLPNVTGDNKPNYLIGLINHAAKYEQSSSEDYFSYLGISAQVWKRSTELSLDVIFGDHSNLKTSPPKGPSWTPAELKSLAHFINCHGAPADPNFYGQKGSSYPVAHAAAHIAGKTSSGCVIAAECCYGAELYDPALAGNKKGICSTYLENKCHGYFGSTTIAYGPANSNDLADLICQEFLLEAISGASIGRACLSARLNYIQKKGGTLTQTDLKTLAQFNLLGDPSLTPVSSAPAHVLTASAKAGDGVEVARRNRLGRRLALAALAVAMPIFQPGTASTGALPKVGIFKKLRDVAAAAGIDTSRSTFITSPVSSTAGPLLAAKAFAAVAGSATLGPQAVHAVIESLPSPSDAKNLRLVRGVDAVEYDGRMEVRQFESR